MDIQTTQFNLTSDDKNLLLSSGQEATIQFIEAWDIDAHNSEFRKTGIAE